MVDEEELTAVAAPSRLCAAVRRNLLNILKRRKGSLLV
jgi:hypothetical protein